MSKKKNKRVSDIITQAAKDIKATVSEDIKAFKDELNKPLFEEKKKDTPKTEEKSSEQAPNDDKSSNEAPSKDSKQKKSKVKKIFRIIFITLLLLSVIGVIFIYYMIHDNNRNTYVSSNNQISEIIKKNYIDGFDNISSTGVFSFSFKEEDINEVLSNVLTSLNDKHIESIYYSKGEENHHYFYVDLDIAVVKTRVVVDTLAFTPGNNKINLALCSVTIGKLNAYSLLKSQGYISSDFVNKIAENSNLPLSFDEDSNSLVVEPLNFIEEFPLGDISRMMFDFVKSDLSSVSLDPSSLGFNVNFNKFRNPNHEEQGETSVPNLSQRIVQGLKNINYNSLPFNEAYKVASLTDKELSSYFNDSFIEVKDEDVTSTLTSNITKFSIRDVNVEFIDAASMRLSYNVSVNGYICNINQNIVLVSGGCDFDTVLLLDVNIYSGSVTFEGINHPHVREMVNIIGEVLDKMNLLHTDDLSSYSSNLSVQFDFGDEVMDAALRKDFNILMLETSVIPNPSNQTLDFCVIKRS